MDNSLSEHITQEEARELAAEKYDQGVFDILDQDNTGYIPREKFLEFLKINDNSDYVELNIVNGTFFGTQETVDLLRSIGGGDRIREMTGRFYDKAFEDQVLDKFVRYHGDHHGERLGNWIIEKMGGEGNIWTESRPRNARQIAHDMAWHSHKREPQKYGQRFKLDDCRVWMRLMFWAARETGLDKNERFFDWYMQFIQHFIRIYERKAPPYTFQDAKWSMKQSNIDKYINDGKIMRDIVGII